VNERVAQVKVSGRVRDRFLYIPHANRLTNKKGIVIQRPKSDDFFDDLNKKQGFNKNLTVEQKSAYDYYQGSGYDSMNKAMLNESPDNPLSEFHQNKLDAMLSGAKELGASGLQMYRYQGMSFLKDLASQYGVSDFKDLVGKVGLFKNMVSMTYNPDKPKSFWDKPHMIVFDDVPSSLMGHLMSDHKWEGEFLANRFVGVKITSVEKVGNYWVTHMRIISQNGKKL